MRIWVFLGCNLKKKIVLFEIRTFELVELQTEKTVYLEPKMSYLGFFRPKVKETIVTFDISTFEFVKM